MLMDVLQCAEKLSSTRRGADLGCTEASGAVYKNIGKDLALFLARRLGDL